MIRRAQGQLEFSAGGRSYVEGGVVQDSSASRRPGFGLLFMGAAALVGTAAICPLTAAAQTPVGGQNVNMVSGTQWPGGAPFLQRQNEPSLAVSSRNPLHLLAGAIDYLTVDPPV